MAISLVFDFGGTKLAAGVVDTARGRVLNKIIFSTPPDAGSSLDAIASMGRELLAQMLERPPKAIGVSFGGPVRMDERTVTASHHVPGWEAFPLAEWLEGRFNLPTLVVNDANAAALGEYRFGAGQGVRHLLYLTASTGIGAGIIIDGEIFNGERALSGEIGHMLLLPDGPECPCGRRGCLEALASGRSIAQNMTNRLDQGAGSSLVGRFMTAKQVAEAAVAGNPAAGQVWSEGMHWLGIGVANAVNLLDPGRVVIGGGLSLSGELLFEPVRGVVRRHALDNKVEIVPAVLGDEANLLGAGLMLEDR